jgi:alpha-tubulin N-acetyltransferase 1
MARFAGSEQRIYLRLNSGRIEGMLKVGKKELFYRDRFGKCKAISPLCVLDFYVHESIQRKGIGKLLFLKMLLSEDITPNELAYDRPSHKLLHFLKKHFNLHRYISQNNNFVIYDDYFEVASISEF